MEIVRKSVDLNDYLDEFDCASYSVSGVCCLSGACCKSSAGSCCKSC